MRIFQPLLQNVSRETNTNIKVKGLRKPAKASLLLIYIFKRVFSYSVFTNLKVNVNAGGTARLSHFAYLPALANVVSLLHRKGAEVCVKGFYSVAVVNNNAVSVGSLPACKHNLAAVGGNNVCTIWAVNINCSVELPRSKESSAGEL